MPHLPDIQTRLTPGMGFDAALDAALGLVGDAGFTAVIYDYTPVPRTHDGVLITPNILEARRVPADMMQLWRSGFYQLDPVQDAALATAAPFVWSGLGRQSRVMETVLCRRHDPVLGYMRDMRFSCGVTVPIHHPGGDLATFTAICIDPDTDFSERAGALAPLVGVIGQSFHEIARAGFSGETRRSRHMRLSPREAQCLSLCAEGLTAKEIARKLDRSVPTVTLHLNSAGRKLGAKNRFQAVARAAHYRLLDAAL
ncbi:helix-turn-helix transcriptional regulator [Antarcticirhabdus aurantiaca]|uniref:Autoinducer binding domain-containing protein n=1 Tax=Antarcticirhabdus aurantiaca TaxID=2606717 RepID=A0ACD4NN24_9HYPH|nr:autoinducer binding domain-containing protein [Antarcticirhabdus aurantiaca]WAJ28266.1 autoinducer binding domain-containing protein [Jeongeuplla avenae]